MLGRRLMMAARQILIGVPSAGAGASSSTLSVAKPIEGGAGALMVAFIITESATSQLGPAGWARQPTRPTNVGLYTKRVEDIEPSNYQWTFGEAINSQGSIVAFSGADLDALGVFTLLTNPVVADSVTASAANSLAVAWFARGANGSVSFSTPPGWTPLVADANASAPSSALFTKAVGAGATGAASSTPSSGSGAGVQLVLKPR